VTSPPYFGLRDYGVDGQIGLEPTPEEYVSRLVEAFRYVKRVLRDDGTLWLNLGDSYYGSWGNYQPSGKGGSRDKSTERFIRRAYDDKTSFRPPTSFKHESLKAKDIIGIPWMVAFALRSDGWYLRSDIIWSKPNPMPESVTDRPTKAHEYIFLLSKSEKYYYDNESVKEDCSKSSIVDYHRRNSLDNKINVNGGYSAIRGDLCRSRSDYMPKDFRRNKRSVWTVTTKAFSGAHFATFPEELIKPCILAGCPEEGIVLDPFFGAGTTGLVALTHNRGFIGIELNPEYIEIAKSRLSSWLHQSRLNEVFA
jgi:DNA modification methylase